MKHLCIIWAIVLLFLGLPFAAAQAVEEDQSTERYQSTEEDNVNDLIGPEPTANSTTTLKIKLNEPLGDTSEIEGSSGVELISKYVSAIYVWGGSMVGVVAVLNMVIAGIQITTAQDSDRAASAKTRIGQSLAAIAVLFLSGLILYTINPNFFVNKEVEQPHQTQP